MRRLFSSEEVVVLSFVCSVLISACGGSSVAPDAYASTPIVQVTTTAAALRASAPSQVTEAPSTLDPFRLHSRATFIPVVSFAPRPLVPSQSDLFSLQKIAVGLQQPTGLAHAGDGSGRLYITERPGRVRVWQAGRLLPTPFLDITAQVSSEGFEQGLLGIAFSPDFVRSRRFFVNYTDRQGATVVAGFLASSNGLTADPSSEWQVMRIPQPYSGHNGGQLAFGPDGMLYIGVGDGGGANDLHNYAQNSRSLLGKLLRIDVSQSSAEQPYRVPADNPSFGPNSRPEIWAIGLRNPWRFSFDRLTGDLYIADVGQGRLEEVNFQPAGQGGQNYGWRFREGTETLYEDAPPDLAFTDPVFQYDHNQGCSIIGGYVYRGAALPALVGAYLFGDFCSGLIWTLRRDNSGNWQGETVLGVPFFISSFGEDEAGELYIIDYYSGALYQFVAPSPYVMR
jgi:glucose/arabinose dehydrogenase